MYLDHHRISTLIHFSNLTQDLPVFHVHIHFCVLSSGCLYHPGYCVYPSPQPRCNRPLPYRHLTLPSQNHSYHQVPKASLTVVHFWSFIISRYMSRSGPCVNSEGQPCSTQGSSLETHVGDASSTLMISSFVLVSI